MVEQELHRARADVADCCRRLSGRRETGLPHRLVEHGGWALFDELLVVALNGAVALAEVHDIAVAIGHHLDLDVTSALDELLHVDARVSERRQRFGLRIAERRRDFVRAAGDSHAASAPATLGLEQHGVAGLVRDASGIVGVLQDAVAAGDQRQAGGAHRLLGRRLLAHQVHHVRRGTDEREPVGLAERRELWVLGQEAPSRVDGGAAGLPSGLDHLRQVEIALGRPRWAHADHLAIFEVLGVSIGFGGREHGRDAHGVASPRDANRDLATVGDEESVEQTRRLRRTHRRGR